ncbi:hypothetical protein EGW08_012162 [Elysia chlorotica]|uniref:Uncharacterized protein n=1 Tax=Elysia chlorotica TaxID=188477 RepID=A0A433TEU9_ELYCH|nr:hypothetical protein EGW08_012162 [Elysia chlorotica]
MGLSRKLGSSGPRAPEIEGSSVPYKWSTQTYTMAELLAKFKLPCVVQCATDSSCSVVWSDFQFDLRQPLLLYQQQTLQKVHAVSVSVPKAESSPDVTEVLEELGPPMAIPCDYEGWFGGAPKGQSKALRHTRVEGVANSTARRFLVTTKLPAFTSSRTVGGAGSGDLDGYVPHDIMPGEVLKRVCVLDPSPADPDCPALVRQNGPCLECLDEKDEDVLIPLSRRALLFEIAEVYPDDMERVFNMRQMVAAGNAKLPRVIKLAHGDPPLLAYAFTGMLRCYTVFTEETILAATLDAVSSICLELATDSLARFRLCLNEAAVKRTCEYSNALYMCDTFGAKFITGIKVSFSLQPELTELEDVDLSFYESQASFSDMQEVEANSEFEISWGAVKKAKLLSSASEDDHYVKREGSSGEDDLFLEGVPEKDEKESDDSEETYAVIKKIAKRPVSDSSLQSPREFTEKDIADLMQRKGMIVTTGHEEENKNGSLLDENKVRHNPLFYYFHREDEEEGNSRKSVPKLSETERTEDGVVTDNLDSCIKTDVESPVEKLSDSITNPLASHDQSDKSAEKGNEDLDASVYEQVVCTPAREYSEDELGGDNSSDGDNDSDNDSDILYGNEDPESPNQSLSLEKTLTQFPIEANVLVKSMNRRGTRVTDDKAPVSRYNTNDTSSSDDVSTILNRFGNSELEKGISLKHKKSRSKDSLRKRSGTDEEPYKNIPSFSPDDSFGKENSFQNKSISSEERSYSPLVASPPKPTFTDVDDSLESTMSELDKVTSIRPSGLITDKNDLCGGVQEYVSSKNPNSISNGLSNKNLMKSNKNTKTMLQQKPKNGCSGSASEGKSTAVSEKSLATQRPKPLQRSLRPLANQSPNKKHADVMQVEDRFDSPRVSHHPHVHPHISPLQHNSSLGALHLGHWTKPVPLGGGPTAKDSCDAGSRSTQNASKVLNSIQSFERLSFSSVNSTDSSADLNSTRRPKQSKTSSGDEDDNQGLDSCVTTEHSKPGANQARTNITEEEDSEEGVTTIEEHFVVSAETITSPDMGLKVLPLYHEDLHPENFV